VVKNELFFEKKRENLSTIHLKIQGDIPFLFLDDGKGFRIVQNGSRQKT